MTKIQLVNCAGEGHIEDHEVAEGTSLSQFLDDVLSSDTNLDALLVRVNRRSVKEEDYHSCRLADGDRISITPSNVSGS